MKIEVVWVLHHTMLLGYILILFWLEDAKSVESVMLAPLFKESLLDGVTKVKMQNQKGPKVQSNPLGVQKSGNFILWLYNMQKMYGLV